MHSLELTVKQRRVLEFIQSFIAVEGIPPTHVEIARGLGFSSPNAATDHVARLKKKGYITYTGNSHRGIKVVA